MNPITGFWTMAKIDRDALMRDMIDVLRRYGLNEDMATANCICTDGEPCVIVFGSLRWSAAPATDSGIGMVKYIDGKSV